MKIGYRKPSFKKRVSARTTGRAKRKAKSFINPSYGKKGVGWINNPKKALYIKAYNKTTVDVFKGAKKTNTSEPDNENEGCIGCVLLIFTLLLVHSVFDFILSAGERWSNKQFWFLAIVIIGYFLYKLLMYYAHKE